MRWIAQLPRCLEDPDHHQPVAGYRALAVDYEQNDFTFDVVEHGPISGAAFTF